MSATKVRVIGGGLAGCEASRRLARAGVETELFEMKPVRFSPAHRSPYLAELVCSNSFRSADPGSAVGLLKEEMRIMGSVIMSAAEKTRVPAGKALAVDREGFAAAVTAEIEALDRVKVIREEVTELDPEQLTVLSTGPLTSEDLSRGLAALVGEEHLYFYDAIAPIVTADSIDMEAVFFGSRYGLPGQGDYLNCPLTKEEYLAFYEALMAAPKVRPRDFEEPKYFEGCLPIEVMAQRGPMTLAFGPMKPVGLEEPRTGRRPFAVVQLRRENQAGTLYNLVGFQTRLKHQEQEKVLRLIPGLKRAEFVRLGSVHRNTFLHAPAHLTRYLQLREATAIFIGGQLSGVEGYVESAAMGILAGENAARAAAGRPLVSPPPTTAVGALVAHLTDQTPRKFQPSNVNFGLMPPPPEKLGKKERPVFMARRALSDLKAWIEEVEYES
ncbi:MAG: methylenetetrahydrofolate--tRNA-(uracil(54)-C(5))-methyltransferase (FADH(2)-oxidizing) TrmFO [Pseudomonadota bacterium]